MVPDHDTKYEENSSSHRGGMREAGLTDGLPDGLMDWKLSYLLRFHLGEAGIKPIPLRQGRE